MNEQYLNKMFEEFKRAYGIKDTVENFSDYQDLFEEWVMLKRKSASHYVQLFDYMDHNDELEIRTMAEFGKGAYDTIAIAMATHTNYQPIVISPYAQTIAKDSGIQTYTGELSLLNNRDVVVKYPSSNDYRMNPNCDPVFRDDIGTFMTQIPYSKKEILPFLSLMESPKILLIGTHGALSDQDRKENLQQLSNLYHQLSNLDSRDVQFCSETQEDSYVSAIKVTPKAKVLRPASAPILRK